MKILIKQFLGKSHSWSIVGWGIATSLIKQGHTIDLFSTDGIEHLPSHLKNNLIGYVEENQTELLGRNPDNDYDMQISYTAMKNFPHYLSNGNKNRFGIWCTEWSGDNILPIGFAKHHNACDYLCPPSQFAKDTFIRAGVPENKIKVISHGIDVKQYSGTSTIKLPTDKKFKILANIAQNHLRKNIPGLLEAYGKAFTNKDDVCLILKGKEKPLKFQFDVSLNQCIKDFKQKFPQHAEIKIFSEFLEDISALYRSVDAVFTSSFGEAYYVPGLEALASGKLNIAPKWGGQLDFLNKDNSLLIEGKEERANPKSMYWESKNNAIWFRPSTDDGAEKLRYAYQNYEKLNKELDSQRQNVYDKYSWDVVAQQFLDLCK